jgi:hypothetical protein
VPHNIHRPTTAPAIGHPSVATLVLTVVLYVASGVSITGGYHRLFAGAETPPTH